MKLKIFAIPFNNVRLQDISIDEEITETRILFKPEVFGPYKMIHEFLTWFYAQPSLCVVTQFPNILNAVGGLISDKVINKDDVEIILVNEDGSRQTFKYDEEGYVIGSEEEHWPIGILDGYIEDLAEVAKRHQDLYEICEKAG